MTVRVISHGPISLKIVLVEDTLLKFQYIMNNSLMNSQNIGMIHKIWEKFTKNWKISQNIGMIHKILECFTKYWKNSQNIGMNHKKMEITSELYCQYNCSQQFYILIQTKLTLISS